MDQSILTKILYGVNCKYQNALNNQTFEDMMVIIWCNYKTALRTEIGLMVLELHNWPIYVCK